MDLWWQSIHIYRQFQIRIIYRGIRYVYGELKSDHADRYTIRRNPYRLLWGRKVFNVWRRLYSVYSVERHGRSYFPRINTTVFNNWNKDIFHNDQAYRGVWFLMEIIRPRPVRLANDKSDQICLQEPTLQLPRNGFLYVGHIIIHILYMYMFLNAFNIFDIYNLYSYSYFIFFSLFFF